jgi:lysozyme family protein
MVQVQTTETMKKYIALILILKYIQFASFGANFDEAFVTTIKHEGVTFTAFHYDNDGGGTKYGFTLKRYKQIAQVEGWKGYDNDKDGAITKNDLRLITMGQVKHLYKRYYWDAVGGDYINSQLVAELFYDYLIHGGLSSRKIQAITGTKIDGKLGAKTFASINNQNFCKLAKRIIKSRGDWLFKTVRHSRPATYKNCKRGWSNRLNYYVTTFKKQCKDEKLNYFRV